MLSQQPITYSSTRPEQNGRAVIKRKLVGADRSTKNGLSILSIVHMSQFHFARAFKAATGTPPHRYLTQQRLERAKVLLQVTRLSVAEVAYRVGFDNKSHFTAQFRKATGTTPKAFRDRSF